MNDLGGLGRSLIFAGLALAVVGLAIVLGPRLPFLSWLGRLPGDFVFRKGPVTVVAPIVTSLLLSLLLSLVLNLVRHR